jgi:hypothetical protein
MKTKKHPIAYAFLLYSISQLALAVTLPVKYDGYLSSSPAYKPGSSSSMLVSATSKPIMQFDLSPLPSNTRASDIEKATLTFYVSSLSRSGKTAINRLVTPWTESALNYTTNLLFDSDPLLTPIISNSASFVSVDVTSLVSGWVEDPMTNSGLIITQAPTNNTSLFIATKESTSRSAYIDVVLKGPIFEYKVGDTGPGGGIIFFVDRYDEYPGFTYLEAAPEPQPAAVLCDADLPVVGWSGSASALGAGKQNTQTLVTSCSSGALKLADDYSTATAQDWYLPNSLEHIKLFESMLNLGLHVFSSSSDVSEFIFWTSNNIFDSSSFIAVNPRNVGNVASLRYPYSTLLKSWPIRSF